MEGGEGTVSLQNEFLNSYTKIEHDAKLNNANIYVSYSGDYKANPLYHVHNSCELLFIEQGVAEYKINDMKYTVGPRSVLIIVGTDLHSRRFTQTPCIRFGLTLLPSYLQRQPIINSLQNIYQTHSPEVAKKLCDLEEDVFQRLMQIIWQLHLETEQNPDGKGDLVYALLLELTIRLKRLLQLEKQEYSEAAQSMQEIKTYIDIHFMEDLSLERLSEQFYLQPNTISKNFRKYYGKNIISYINAVRISNAARILGQREVKITDLAEEVGYHSINTFLRQFREKMNISPLQYKKNLEKSRAEMEWEKFF